MLHKLMFLLFSGVLVAGAGMGVDDAGNPGCRMVAADRLGGLWAECESDGCPNPCTSDLVQIPGAALVYYCPCGNWDDEAPNLLCLPTYTQSDPPVFGGGKLDCEAVCVTGCVLQPLGWFFSPACSKCQ